MQVKTVLKRVHRVKGFVYGKGQWVNDRMEVEVRPRTGSRPVCSGWGRLSRAMTPWPQGTFISCRGGPSLSFWSARCVGWTVVAAGSPSSRFPGATASGSGPGPVPCSWPPGGVG